MQTSTNSSQLKVRKPQADEPAALGPVAAGWADQSAHSSCNCQGVHGLTSQAVWV